MGCSDSKSGKKGKTKGGDDAYSKIDEDEYIEEMDTASRRTGDKNSKVKFSQLVIEAITNSKGLISISNIETYITNKYRMITLNSFRRRGIIAKVIADEFVRGNVAIKSITHC